LRGNHHYEIEKITYLKSFASLFLLLASSIIPSLIFLPKLFQNFKYFSLDSSFFSSSTFFSSFFSLSSFFSPSSSSSSSSSSSPLANYIIISIAFLTSFLLITFNIFNYWSYSRLTFNGKLSESTTPLMKFKYLGIKSSNSSWISTRRTYSFIA